MAAFLLNLLVNVGLFYWGYKKGYKAAETNIKAQTNMDKKILDNHAKELQTIHSESSDSVKSRLDKNLRSN